MKSPIAGDQMIFNEVVVNVRFHPDNSPFVYHSCGEK
jgi:hypothetical protein